MQLYLCEKYDKDHKISFPYDSDEYWETVEWLVWMVSSISQWQQRARIIWHVKSHDLLHPRKLLSDACENDC